MIDITIPRLGWSMDEGTFAGWLKSPGEFVHKGDAVFELEGEKASQEIESFDAGVLCVPDDAPKPGDTVRVGQLIGFLLAEGDEPAASLGASPHRSATLGSTHAKAPHKSPVGTSALTSPERVAGPAPASRRGKTTSSPRARQRAKALGIEWQQVPGTGRNGRVREQDVISFAKRATSKAPSPDAESQREEPATPTVPGEHQPASQHRLAVARRMMEGVHQAAPVTLNTKVNASRLVLLCNEWRAAGADVQPSYTDILIKLAAIALKEQPQLNACWHDDGVWSFQEINIAMAVDTSFGLMAPVIRNADTLSLSTIAKHSQTLIAQAHSGHLSQSQLHGGTFTVTNLGMFGIDAFTPILNLPQAAILGVGRISQEPIVACGKIVPGDTLTLSLTFDHRVTDGAPAARWLQRLSELIETATDTLGGR